MNSYLNKNLRLFENRFPDLYSEHKDIFLQAQAELNRNFDEAAIPAASQLLLPSSCELLAAKSGAVTLKENGLLHHSLYDPEKEALRLIQTAFPHSAGREQNGSARSADDSHTAGVFSAFGLGYAVIEYARRFPQNTLVIIETDARRLIPAFFCTDWTPFFSNGSIIFLVGAPHETVIAVLEKIGIENCRFFSLPAQTVHAESWFSSLHTLIERNRQKKDINDRTREVFSRLWLRNTAVNSREYARLSSIAPLKNSAENTDACVLAAGPTLSEVLPYLAEIKKRALVVCVDTALRACLSVHVQPDVIMLSDPQYWNSRHIAGLSAPDSILVTETAAWPSVFRFPCRQICLYASQYPVGKYLEQQFEKRGYPSYPQLGAGGSVASTAWDFARFAGCRAVYLAGLDLGFPNRQTHIRGSTFETAAADSASRTIPAETANADALLGAFPFYGKDYLGNDILTDKRMSLYAWWFESKCAQYNNFRTYTLTPKSLKIPGVQTAPLDAILSQKDRSSETDIFLQKRIPHTQLISAETLACITENLAESLHELNGIAHQCLQTCKNALENSKKQDPSAAEQKSVFRALSEYDNIILRAECAEIAALVFPARRQLEKAYARICTDESAYRQSVGKTKITYEQIAASIQYALKILQKNAGIS
ncbi:MAG: DUF115 domain-containing protein [Bacteroides sp.]|nr:DUF115 domain-containing protein [Prevotella sp.]MCM1408751.1 DUF115 domain-containing protein [Treponema brennaborense]MCM1470666.1 DUF115 domain-containing protein [Bacteroides sp.]